MIKNIILQNDLIDFQVIHKIYKRFTSQILSKKKTKKKQRKPSKFSRKRYQNLSQEKKKKLEYDQKRYRNIYGKIKNKTISQIKTN